MKTLGIDLASQPKTTAVCLIDWAGAEPEILTLHAGADDDWILALVRLAARTGIDAPLGWPVAFVAALRENRWPSTNEHLTHRATDHWVRAQTGKVPLSVSTDRIAYCAMRAARVLAHLDGVDRSGVDGPVCEVYPDPSLTRFGLREGRASYKRAAEDARREIVARLPAWVGPQARGLCIGSDDLLDAFVCALVARAVALGLTEPVPDEHRDAARAEGWIHLPRPGVLDALHP